MEDFPRSISPLTGPSGYFTPSITTFWTHLVGQGVSFGAKFHFFVFGTTTAGLPAGVGGEVSHQLENHQKLAKRKLFEKGWCALIVLLLAPIYRIEESRCFVLVVRKCYKLCGFIGDDIFMMPSH